MTVRATLHARRPAPPERLIRAIEAALGDHLAAPPAEFSTRCVDAAESLLRDLLNRPTAGRESALDLLTVDALVTYAFEAAAAEPATLEGRAHEAARRLAALATE